MKKNHDYHAFMETDEQQAPIYLKQNILERIQSDFHISSRLVWTKFATIHALIGLVSLLFCPQFNLSLSGKKDLYYFFHQALGHEGCMIACGAIFLGTGAIMTALILSKREVLLVRQSLMLAFIILALISLGLFFAFGAEIYLDLVGPWLLGAIIGGASSFKLTGIFRERLTA